MAAVTEQPARHQKPESPWRQPHRWIIIGVAVALLIVGLVAFHFHNVTETANAKADQLTSELHAAGLPAPSHDTITRLLSDDGGAVCDNPGSSLNKALLDAQLVNGAAFVGQRPILADTNLIRGELIVLRVYCPDQIDKFKESVGNYHTDEVAGE